MGAEQSKHPPPEVTSFLLPKTWSARIGVLRRSTFRDTNQLLKCIGDESFNPDVKSLDGLRKAVVDHFGENSTSFFDLLLPFIVKTAGELENLLPSGGVPLLRAEQSGLVVISRVLASSFLANLFLCTFRHGEVPFEASFLPLFHRDAGSQQETAKLRCFLHYFERLQEKPEPRGKLYIRRRVLEPKELPDWRKCKATLQPVEVLVEGVIEDAEGCLQVDFANKHLGGGVLVGGCVQEEIRFSINPELVVGMVLCEDMKDHEAIIITGAERFSSYDGYAFSLQYAGDYEDKTACDTDGTVQTSITCIDALPFAYGGRSLQLRPDNIRREAQKALAGFLDNEKDDASEWSPVHYPTIATGNWGCGAFGGNAQLKSLLQMAAASVAGRRVKYFTFKNNAAMAAPLQSLADGLVKKKITVGELWKAIHRIPRDGGPDIMHNILALVGSQFDISLPVAGEQLPPLLSKPSYDDSQLAD